MRRLGRLLKNELVTGLVLLAPIAGTAYLVVWIVRAVDSVLPERFRPHILGEPVPGVGVLLVLLLALTVGIIAHNFVGRRLVTLIDRVLSALPLFGGTYGLIKQVFESVFSQGADSFNRAVLVEYPRPGSYAIAFVTASHVQIKSATGQELISVFVPTTPNPTSGFYLLVERTLVRDLEDVRAAGVQAGHHHGHTAREPDFDPPRRPGCGATAAPSRSSSRPLRNLVELLRQPLPIKAADLRPQPVERALFDEAIFQRLRVAVGGVVGQSIAVALLARQIG